MKRRMIAAATLGTLILGAGNPAVADECQQVRPSESMVCREIAAGDLGPAMCLATERFEFRGVKPSSDHDPWVTKEDVKLGAFAFRPTKSGCNGGIPLGTSTLSIAKTANGYHAKLTGATNAEMDMMAAKDASNNDLWLSGPDSAHSNINYFVYFRDQSAAGASQAGSAALPKFLVIEALDFNNPLCKNVAPSLEKATVKSGPCEHAGGGKPRETGVGGGGEHKGP